MSKISSSVSVLLLLIGYVQPDVAETPHRPDISPIGRMGPLEPCVNATSGEEGRCMFAMDCFRSSGRHIGVCTKGFYFGSCCSFLDDPHQQDLARVPIVLPGTNAIDGPFSSWNFWPDLLNDIYGPLQQQQQSPPIHLPFPFSNFHAPISTTREPEKTSTSSTILSTATTTNQVNQNVTQGNTLATTSTSTSSTSSMPSTSTTTISSSSHRPIGPVNVTIIYANVSGPESFFPSGEMSELETDENPSDFITSTPLVPTTSIPDIISLTVALNATNMKLMAAISKSSNTTSRSDSTATVCGKPVYRWPKIVSGENARPGQWPWQISLQEKTRRGYFHKCGASLLTREWAITAAHCLNNVQSENLLVRLGGTDLASYQDKFEESKVLSFQHPKFNVQTRQYDIGLLKLLTPVTYQPNTLPICLPDRNMQFDDDQLSFVSGWGRLSEKGPTSTKLQYVGVPIINNTECERIYRPVNKYIDHQCICAGFPMGLKDSCEGDSGGPMMVFKGRWVLAGVISWGVGCARPNQPGVSTRVSEFLDWIQSYIGDEAS